MTFKDQIKEGIPNNLPEKTNLCLQLGVPSPPAKLIAIFKEALSSSIVKDS